MKKRNFLILSSISVLTITAGVALAFSPRKGVVAYAYDTSKLPTTIDLNDSTEAEIRSYYSSLDSLSESERQGNNLLKNLKTILKNGQKYYSYDTDNNGRKIWQIYEIADRDWEKSPASELAGYDSTTNTISNYTYGESPTKSGTNPFIHSLYVDRNANNMVRAWAKDGTTSSSHGNNAEWCIDREHIWPKSQGFEEEGKGGARGDPMHLWPGDSDVNSAIHNNNLYGFVKDTNITARGKWSYGTANLLGKSATLNNNNDVFEPQDSDKGDIARSIFYMVARYNDVAGDDTIDKDNPNLELVQDNAVLASYTSSKTVTGKMGILTDLLEWNKLDPVDEFEIHRNNLLYKNYTNNRNPFIDFPEWADYIWGTVEYTGKQLVSSNLTPSGAANPQSDSINDSATLLSLEVSGTLNKTSYYQYEKFDPSGLTVTAIYDGAPNENVTNQVQWDEINTTGATAVIGRLHGKTVEVTIDPVVANTLESIVLSGMTTEIEKGQEYHFDGVVTATYANPSSNKPSRVISSGYVVSTVDTSKASKDGVPVVVTYAENGVTKADTFLLIINDVPFYQTTMFYIIVAAVVAVIIIIILIVLLSSKKGRKKLAKATTKAVKSVVKSNTSSTKKKSSSSTTKKKSTSGKKK